MSIPNVGESRGDFGAALVAQAQPRRLDADVGGEWSRAGGSHLGDRDALGYALSFARAVIRAGTTRALSTSEIAETRSDL
jgi:hypothetical protein